MVPVANLAKKSRGRRVPIADSLATTVGTSVKGADGVGGNLRTYTCDAAGCATEGHPSSEKQVGSIHTRECFLSLLPQASQASPALLIVQCTDVDVTRTSAVTIISDSICGCTKVSTTFQQGKACRVPGRYRGRGFMALR